MKESVWRSQLIKSFKLNHFQDFIWSMDAKFKAGFPDLYVILGGKSAHYELKILSRKTEVTSEKIISLFSPIQLSVLKSINKAGGRAKGLVYNPVLKEVYIYDPTDDSILRTTKYEFDRKWTGV